MFRRKETLKETLTLMFSFDPFLFFSFLFFSFFCEILGTPLTEAEHLRER